MFTIGSIFLIRISDNLVIKAIESDERKIKNNQRPADRQEVILSGILQSLRLASYLLTGILIALGIIADILYFGIVRNIH